MRASFKKIISCAVLVLSFASVSFAASEGGDGTCANQLTGGSESSKGFKSLVSKYTKWIKNHVQVATNQKEVAEALDWSANDVKEALAGGKLATVKDLNKLIKDTETELFTKFREKLLRVASAAFKETLRLPTVEEYSQALGTPVEDIEAIYGKLDSVYSDLAATESSGYLAARKYVINAYSSVARATSRTPTMEEIQAEIQSAGKSSDFVFSSNGKPALYKDLADLKMIAQLTKPDLFERIVDEEVHSLDKAREVADLFVRKKRVLLTSAYSGVPVHRGTFYSLVQYAKAMDAEIVVIPLNGATSGLDPILSETPGVHILLDEIQITKWLRIDGIGVMGKMLNPLANLDLLGERGETRIIAAPRLDAVTVPITDNMLRAHQEFTIGSLHTPDVYRSPKFIGQRTDKIASELHKMGALLVEKADGKGLFNQGETVGEFHLRQLEYIGVDKPGQPQWKPEEKGIYDLGRLFTESGVFDYRPDALVLGDLHIAQMSREVVDSLITLIKRVRPKRIVLHDFFDGTSISHHDAKDVFTMIHKFYRGESDLARELSEAAAFINSLLAIDPTIELDVIKSNHDHWLYRWIQNGDHFKAQTRDRNADIAIELGPVMMAGAAAVNPLTGKTIRFTKDPIEYALLNGVRNDPVTGKAGTLTISDPSRVVFTDSSTSLKFGPEEPWRSEYLVEAGNHGDRSSDGGRGGSPRTMGRGGGRILYGHTHKKLMRSHNGVNIGSLLPSRVGYTMGGFSSWGSSVGLISPFGHIEALQYVDGQWFMENEDSTALSPENFYRNYKPVVIPNAKRSKEPTGAGIDQWSGNAADKKKKK